jgi:hypothetical protein
MQNEIDFIHSTILLGYYYGLCWTIIPVLYGLWFWIFNLGAPKSKRRFLVDLVVDSPGLPFWRSNSQFPISNPTSHHASTFVAYW